ncbi:cytochrome b/b6 domain-containing protein [Lichenifustis flavocetrariae]|uniref:Cytochrome b/b6 domain-containing protein n=1 Tax=Lichenifustis flavocetrariae TaxID=2949735 RepID=A0AA41YXP1_9HYPH|nr:cytochrome b/b6 domain-containing protein [Lichenifustis flavocetrariae]MCW6510469.1 cytochrome b/b6 domain-containing protein [Lichenifustis flavocetrariae]
MTSAAVQGLRTTDAPETADVDRRRWVFRHPALIRVCHWINVACLTILLMSGLQIFNAHPALYWGSISTFEHPWASIGADQDAQPPKGVTTVAGHSFTTTGVLGLSRDAGGDMTERGFPRWITLPADQDLATGRRWHFFFAWLFVINGAIYLAYGFASGQFRARYVPTGAQWRHIGASIKEHLLLRFAEGEEARHYNVIQKLTYFVVVLGLLPIQILAGLAMSPGMNSVTPWLLTLFGGRQSARTIHFIVADLLVLFVVVHVALVILSGFWNNMRGMVSGWYIIDRKQKTVPHV